MQFVKILVAVVGLAIVTTAIALSGRGVGVAPAVDFEAETVSSAGADVVPVPKPMMTNQHARAVASDVIVPGVGASLPLERVDARKPLSDLALALPPKPVTPDKWEGTPLYRPIALESARFEAMGYKIAIRGADSVPADAMCDFAGKSWPCGVRARTAVRLWLRGRALSCVVPPEADRTPLNVSCKLGEQDAGAWLVAAGWARASAGGPYADLQREAETAKRGIFGPPPDPLAPAKEFPIAPPVDATLPTVLAEPSESAPVSP